MIEHHGGQITKLGGVGASSLIQMEVKVPVDGMPDTKGRMPHLVYKPFLDAAMLSERSPASWISVPNGAHEAGRQIYYTDDGRSFFCPMGGELEIHGGRQTASGAPYECYVTRRTSAKRPGRSKWRLSYSFAPPDDRILGVPICYGAQWFRACCEGRFHMKYGYPAAWNFTVDITTLEANLKIAIPQGVRFFDFQSFDVPSGCVLIMGGVI